MAEHNELGAKGEEVALSYLQAKGYQLRERNWRFQKAEIDLVMETKDALVVVEVKTRENNYIGDPEMAVKKAKQKLLVFAANEYVQQHQITKETRFDIIGIILNSRGTQISHIEGAFNPALVKLTKFR